MSKNIGFEKYADFIPPNEWLEGETEAPDLSNVIQSDKNCSDDLDDEDSVERMPAYKVREHITDGECPKRFRRKHYDKKNEISFLDKEVDAVVSSENQTKEQPFFISKDDLERSLPFKPIEKLGQNFLINPDIVKLFTDSTLYGADVVEIGTGPGNLTIGIAEKARRVIGLEIYSGYVEIQQKYLANFSNIEIIIGDALRFDFKKWINEFPDSLHQIMGNIPFHISEPLLTRCAQLGNKIDRITLLVGENLREIIDSSRDPYHEGYSRLAFVISVYDVEELVKLDKDDFWPAPPVNGGFIVLSPRECDLKGKNTSLSIRRQIIQNPNLAVGKIIKSEIRKLTSSKKLDSNASNRYNRRQAKIHVSEMINRQGFVSGQETNNDIQENKLAKRIDISSKILETPFNRLTNQQIRELAIMLHNL
jgi:16S rRNA (adenine1518-N6/adenine1519-N6)-dimethyltransferase